MYMIYTIFLISVLIRYVSLGIKDEPECESSLRQMIRHQALKNKWIV